MQVVAHNLASQFTNRQLNMTTSRKSKSAEKLSSGYRINRSADDAAGLQISEKMRSLIRGLNKASKNIQDGISLCQVADGALEEVHDILQRMNELSVQAASDTNTIEDRQAIQDEINSLLMEIDRIGSDTEFNTQKIFQGGYTDMLDPNGNPIPISNIPVSDFQLARADLQNYPFFAGSDGQYLKLAVSTVSGYTETNWNLIYGNGYTSHSSVRISYEDDNGNRISKQCEIGDMEITNTEIFDGGTRCVRTFSYDAGNGAKINVQQSINVTANNGAEQYYQMGWHISNVGQREVETEFMFNADTAYNNNDHCEEYYINGQKVENFCLYTSDPQYLNQNSGYIYDMSSLNSNSISIIDGDSALPFSEKIIWSSARNPVAVSIGNWPNRTGDWSYYDSLDSYLGGNTANKDMAFSLIWSDTLSQGNLMDIQFQYGIVKASADANLNGVSINYNNSTQVHVNQLDLWIQSAATSNGGMFITIGEMNSGELGLRGLNVTTYNGARHAISYVDRAIEKISSQRATIGAQQNRLEYAKAVDDNTAENVQYAESRIRDTDMAEEMVNYSKHNMLEQVGQSMLAQANQSNQGILSLLS